MRLTDDDLGRVLDWTAITSDRLQHGPDFIGDLSLVAASLVVAARKMGHEPEGKREDMLTIKLVSYRKLLKHIVSADEIVDPFDVNIPHCLELTCLRALNEKHKRSTG